MDEKIQTQASSAGFKLREKLAPYLKVLIVIGAAAISWSLILSFSRLAEALIR